MNMRVLMVAFALSVSWSAVTWAEAGVPGHRLVIPIRGSGWWAPVDTPAACAINSSTATIPTATHDSVPVPTYRCKQGWWDEE